MKTDFASYNKYGGPEVFNFSNCSKDKDGNSYYFDRERGEVLRVRAEKVAIKTVPQEVLLDLLIKEGKQEAHSAELKEK